MVFILFVGCSKPEAVPTELNEIGKLQVKGEYKQAADLLSKYLEENPEDSLAWTMLGSCYQSLGNNNEARKALKIALKFDPEKVHALSTLGIIARQEKDYDKAIEYYEQAIEIDPKFAQAYSGIAVVALKKYDNAKALDFAKKAYNLNESDPVIASNLSIMYHYNGMKEKRDEMAQRSKELGNPNMAQLEKIFSGQLNLQEDGKADKKK